MSTWNSFATEKTAGKVDYNYLYQHALTFILKAKLVYFVKTFILKAMLVYFVKTFILKAMLV